jgi:hypothetical protein
MYAAPSAPKNRPDSLHRQRRREQQPGRDRMPRSGPVDEADDDDGGRERGDVDVLGRETR